MNRFAQHFGWLIVQMAALLSITCGCSSVGGKSDSEERAQQIERLQLRVMQFADEYVAQIVGPLSSLQSQTADPRVRLDAQNWKINQAASAYANASEPNPVDGALDMIVLATLSRMVIEDENADPASPLRSRQLQEAHRKLESTVWELATVLTEQQKLQLRQALRDWRFANPNVKAVFLVHYGDLLELVPSDKKRAMSIRLLGRSLDPAVREIAQTRQFAERSIYYAQRLPALLDMQVERLVYQLALMPESSQLLADLNRVAGAAERAGQLADALPGALTQEREAAIAQIARELNAQQANTRELARDLRNLLEAGTHTSDSVNTTIRSLDALIARLQPDRISPKPPHSGTSTPGTAAAEKAAATPSETKRSQVNDYMQALHELSKTTQELQTLIRTLDESAGGIEHLVTASTLNATTLVDHIVLRIILLALALAVLILATALAYRALSRRADSTGARG